MTFDEQMLALLQRLKQRTREIFPGTEPDDPQDILSRYHEVLDGPLWSRAHQSSLIGRIGLHLVDRAELNTEEFWATPLGRQVAWHVGYPLPECPVRLVGSIVGASRQYGYRQSMDWPATWDSAGRKHVPSTAVRELARRCAAHRGRLPST